jgi:hypothetical protein
LEFFCHFFFIVVIVIVIVVIVVIVVVVAVVVVFFFDSYFFFFASLPILQEARDSHVRFNFLHAQIKAKCKTYHFIRIIKQVFAILIIIIIHLIGT